MTAEFDADELTEGTDEREEVGLGGLPSETQLVLLCLDYLRDLRRAYSVEELAEVEGVDANYLSLSIYALSRSFLRPQHLLHTTDDAGNDAWLDRSKGNIVLPGSFPPPPGPDLTTQSKITLPSLDAINQEVLYDRDPDSVADNKFGSDVGEGPKYVPASESYGWYEYDDAHLSNSHRFYPLNGLASGPSLRGPLTLGEIAAAGLAGLGARSRHDAERDMMKSPLFEQFVGAVRAKGFFRDPETETPMENPDEERIRQQRAAEVYEDRFRKVVGKFRTKLATRAQQQEGGAMSPVNVGGPLSGNLLALSAADRHVRRRQRRKHSARLRIENGTAGGGFQHYDEHNQPPHERQRRIGQTKAEGGLGMDQRRGLAGTASFETSVISSLTQKLAPQSPTKRRTTGNHAVDLEEAEKLKSQGNASMQQKQYEDAADAYTAALKLSPSGPQSHVYFSNRAAALLSMKKFHDAILDSERSLALKPDYGKAHARLGLAHFLLGNYRQAMEAYTVALKYEPDNKSSKTYLDKAAKRLARQESANGGGGGNVGSSYSVVSEWDRSETHRSTKSAGISVASLEDDDSPLFSRVVASGWLETSVVSVAVLFASAIAPASLPAAPELDVEEFSAIASESLAFKVVLELPELELFV